jgi:ribosomal peptide maturation radical SAM protein 1
MPGHPLPLWVAGSDATAPPDRATAEERSAWPVLLVVMPFASVTQPSIQLGLLKAIARAHGYAADTLHANLELAGRIGAELYYALCQNRNRMLGEWLFSPAAFGDAAPDPDNRLLDDFIDCLSFLPGSLEQRRSQLLRLRHDDIPKYLDGLVDHGPWRDARVVGFSSTFQQNTASFALARRLKEGFPDIVTVFGGANFDDEMGLEWVRAIHGIDFAVIGEGDVAFPGLLDALATGADPAAVPGVARREGDTVVHRTPAPLVQRLDDLPTPDYEEYFTRAQDLGLLERQAHRNVWIPFESARGCWWGEKHHCTFCGLNGATMRFRAKSPRRVLDELAQQARAYRSFHFEAVDNIIDMAYLKDLLPALIESGAGYHFFYETKSNLTRAQLKLMAQAGLTSIQPGVESLSSNVLRLMRKGVRAAQNVNVLRWGRYYDLAVAWNILWGFPGESKEDYVEQAAVIPHLVHLQPPQAVGRISMDRFSPLFVQPQAFRVVSRSPEPTYRYVYPEGVNLDRAAYYFQYEMEDALPATAYADLRRAADEWKTAWESGTDQRPVLTYWSAPGFLQIYDGRHKGSEGTYTFEDVLADIYVACGERPVSASTVREKLGLDLPVEAVQEVFVEFQRRGLMFLDESLALSLALPAVAGR